ncbi:hypothetical protein GCM10010913_48230 [Paenibacillus aceti]|uniref:Knr4/Smi1-like domain-containing protein n=2 Tax=Paenibacillus aceti TaxID=1820010 RepID=A0ABQ1WA13_9BACL|nr:SMI1/KNR4 family protein [Paenibacillus aceti]GGG20360.1 hypothetical protein GCM10010913_48230 [Paenibacillus aceti]
MRDELEAKLNALHEEDQFEEIVNTIKDIPAEDRDYSLVSHLGRALNNLERYEEAIEQFLSVAEEGKDDALWHYRMGLAYYYLDRYEEARKEFELADKLEPDDEDTLEFLEWIASKTEQETAESVPAEPDPEPETETSPEPAMKPQPITDPEWSEFWNDSESALKEYVSDPVTDEQIASIEEGLVFKLPASYIRMMKLHNGGVPHNTKFPIGEKTSRGDNHITISGFFGIGRDKPKSLCGKQGSRYMIENWNYPEIGVVICDCPATGDAVMLDYRPSGNDGEPVVIYIDREADNKVIKLADHFEAFIQGLVKAEDSAD